jgi:hypothetical protein
LSLKETDQIAHPNSTTGEITLDLY